MKKHKKFYIGQKFGRLAILKYHSKKKIANSSGYYHYYLCHCQCGKKAVILFQNLRRHLTQSCGCIRKDMFKQKRIRNGLNNSIYNVYSVYKYKAKERNIKFYLTLDEFKNLTSSNCYYCGQTPNQTVKCHKNKYGYNYIYNGIDRINSKKSYIIENCVSCCKWCNFAKQTRTIKEFKTWVKKIYNHMGKK